MWAYERSGLMVLNETDDVGEPICNVQTCMGIALNWTALLWLTVDDAETSAVLDGTGGDADVHGGDYRGD